ncbi:MAG TPA: hypothetical protein VN635_01225 [Conexibacter sp.]|nr:hypothetical protein [Conexibacter sp.]
MSTPTYRHLEAKLRVAELTIAQWAGVGVGLLLAFGWAQLSPFGTKLTLFVGIYLAGLPATVAFVASQTDYDFWIHVRALGRWHAGGGRYAPGPGAAAHGYALRAPSSRERDALADRSVPALDVDALWER